MRERWVEYHTHMATLHGRLAEEHEAKALELENGQRYDDKRKKFERGEN